MNDLYPAGANWQGAFLSLCVFRMVIRRPLFRDIHSAVFSERTGQIRMRLGQRRSGAPGNFPVKQQIIKCKSIYGRDPALKYV